MLTAPIPVVLRQMTGPMIFGIIAILAFNLVDTFFIGMLGTEALPFPSLLWLPRWRWDWAPDCQR